MGDSDSGLQRGRRPAINPEDVLEVIESADKPFLSTGQVAERVDASKPTVHDRLKTLREEGKIASHEVAGNTPVWYLPAHANPTLSEDADGERPESEPSRHTPDPDGGADTAEARELVGEVEDRLERKVREVFRDVLEEYEEKRAREASDGVATWGELARDRARFWVHVLLASALVGFMNFSALFLAPESLLTPTVQPFGALKIYRFFVFGIVVGTAGVLVGALGAVVYGGAALSGLADRAERGWLGDKWRKLRQQLE